MPELPIEVVRIATDVVVVGGGGAASRAALSARQAGAAVRMMSKAPLKRGGSTVHGASEIMSMGAAAGLGDKRDRPEIHFEDTMRPARGFIDERLVRVLVEDAPRRLHDLIEMGVPFDRNPDETYRLIKSDFGTYGRAAGVRGRTGRALVEALTAGIVDSGVEVDAPVMLVDLVCDRDGAICGVLGYNPADRCLVHYEAPAVVLGTGGMHGAFSQQVSTPEMTGDGQAVCFRHGAELVNVEFHQFGPAMIHPYVQLFSKSIFALEPRVMNALGEEFLHRYLPEGVAARDVLHEKVFPFTTSNVSRYLDIAIFREINEGRGNERGAVNFSFGHVEDAALAGGAPNTYGWLKDRGLSMRDDLLEVGIAFQCMNGGVRMTDTDAQSSIPGLYVIGELAGGIRGPDRPGGNSLAEGQVFGHRAGAAAAGRTRQGRAGDPATLDQSLDLLAGALARQRGTDHEEVSLDLRRRMQRHCLVEKTETGLSETLEAVLAGQRALDAELALTPDNLIEGLSVRNLAQASELVLRACLHRRETRSGHYRLDHPQADDAAYRWSFVIKRDGGEAAIVPFDYEAARPAAATA